MDEALERKLAELVTDVEEYMVGSIGYGHGREKVSPRAIQQHLDDPDIARWIDRMRQNKGVRGKRL